MPESPASFLKFLFKVRESGSLGPEHGPSVVHCSAGIGRSGTFALVDTCLILVGVVVAQQADRVTVKQKGFLQRGWHQSFDIYTKNNTFSVSQETRVVVRQDVERIVLFLVQQIQREQLWHVGVFMDCIRNFHHFFLQKVLRLAGCCSWWG